VNSIGDQKAAIRAYKREWRARNRDKCREYSRRYRAKKKKLLEAVDIMPESGQAMTEAEYRARPEVNKSTLWQIRRSPAHYRYALDHPPADTPSLRLGRAIHAAILQPEEYARQYTTPPAGLDRRTKDGKAAYEAFLLEAEGKELLSAEERAQVDGIARAVLHNQAAAALLDGCAVERPIFWTDQSTGIQCKARIDAYKSGIIIDLKSCTDASTGAFLRDAIKYGYDVQAAHYIRAVRSINGGQPLAFYFIAVEKTEPHAVNVIRAGDAFLDRGTWQLMGLMDKLKECRESDTWPGYGENELILPEWAEIPDDE
jgi:hypothetical protein